jgi:hypothetical protein
VNGFNVCVGVTWMSTGTPTAWTAKNVSTGALIPAEVVPGGDPLTFWGWAPDASALTQAQRNAGNPYISLRTKDATILGPALGLTAAQVAALPFKSGDLAIVVNSAFPWDGKYGGP